VKGYQKLGRLPNRKILGGVCAGFAHYLAMDPLWTRLITILLLFSGGFRIGPNNFHFFPWDADFYFSFGWWTAFAYILLWIILPVSYEEPRSEEHTSELQSRENLVCRLLLEKKNYTSTT